MLYICRTEKKQNRLFKTEGLLATSPAKSNYIRNNEKLSNDWGVLKQGS